MCSIWMPLKMETPIGNPNRRRVAMLPFSLRRGSRRSTMEISEPVLLLTPAPLGSELTPTPTPTPTPTNKPEFSPTAVSQTYRPIRSYSPTREARVKEERYSCMFTIPLISPVEFQANLYINALYALEYYNKKNGTKYELVQCWDSDHFEWYMYPVIHMNFECKQDEDYNIFFAEMLLDNRLFEKKMTGSEEATSTLIITACLTLEGGPLAGDCDMCSGAIHPPNGFLIGHKPEYLPTSPLYSKPLPPYSMSENPDYLKLSASEKAKESDELCGRAQTALEKYNNKNKTNYELVEFLDSKCISWNGFWMHCNFTAKSTKVRIHGGSTSKLFFAEFLATVKDESLIWTVKACHALDGTTTYGCKFCPAIYHPTHGFCQGGTRAPRDPPGNTLSRDLTDSQKHDGRAEIALQHYNKKHGSNYDLVDVMISKRFLSKGTWYHYNFTAKQDVGGKYTCRWFFAEILVMYSCEMETLTVNACLILDGETEVGCGLCSDVVHPTYGFSKGLDKGSYLRTPPLYSPTLPTYSMPDHLEGVSISDKESDELRIRAKIALEEYNKNNATDYELVDFLDSKCICCNGFWMHFNFTAVDGESTPKLFFAEILADAKDNTLTWTVKACHVLDGKTTDGCQFCSGIIHPIRGFCQGISRENNPLIHEVLSSLPSSEKRCRRAMIGLELYNRIHGTNYELVHVILSNGFSSDGIWYHVNFEAKHDVNGKYTSNIFFAELLGDVKSTKDTYIATSCHILGDETRTNCGFCSNVVHPSEGFLKGSIEMKVQPSRKRSWCV